MSVRHFALAALALSLAACSGTPDVSTQREVSVALAGAAGMNAGGNAVVVRVYQLTGDTPFALVPLEDFWASGDAALDGTLVSKREVLLYPEEVRAVPLALEARTTHVGVAADFRSPSLDNWRAVFAADLVAAEGLGVLVGDSSLVITGPAPIGPAAPTPAPPPEASGASPADSTGGGQ